MIKNFKNKFGEPNKTLIILGDYGRANNIRGKETTICKKFRKIFKRNNYETYLIDEYNTSKICNICHDTKKVTKTFEKRESKKPKKNKEEETVWGLLRCTSDKFKAIFNRDENAARNMLFISTEIISGNERPKAFRRTQTHTS